MVSKLQDRSIEQYMVEERIMVKRIAILINSTYRLCCRLYDRSYHHIKNQI